MGKSRKNADERETLFASAAAEDDGAESSAGPVVTRYRNDPHAAMAADGAMAMAAYGGACDEGITETRYRDDPGDGGGGSVFDWCDGGGDGGTVGGYRGEKTEEVVDLLDGQVGVRGGDTYCVDDFEPDSAHVFAPVSLRDSDDDDEEGDEENRVTDSKRNGERIRLESNSLLNQRVFDDTTYDGMDDRIFVGGGWGRHGSQFSCCLHGFCSCGRSSKPSYSPHMRRKSSLCWNFCFGISFLAMVVGSGYLGYEAGLPVDDGVDDLAGSGEEATNNTLPYHPHTKGEEWLEWLEHERDGFHMPHWEFHHSENLNGKDLDAASAKPGFEPKTQAELLHLSERVFQSCSERSLATATGRHACMSLCHGHFCCFEKDAAFGSCVSEENSYCFAYAACENAVGDFKMNNANTEVKKKSTGEGRNSHDEILNAIDVKLLSDTCSQENIVTLEGIRDCTAFCQHHLCCFNMLEGENCRATHAGECQAYDACRELVDGPGNISGGALGDEAGGAIGPGNTAPLTPNDISAGADAQHNFKFECMGPNLYDNYDICEQRCSKYECCFRLIDSCYNSNALECDEYYVCEDFFVDDGDGETKEVGMKYFQQQQQPGAFNPKVEENSNNDDKVNTPDLPVRGVHDHAGGDTNRDIETAVHAVCGLEDEHPGDDSWVSICHALCASYLCCFSTDGTQSNCRDSYGDELCNAYQGCVVLHTAAGNASSYSGMGNGTNYNPRAASSESHQWLEVMAVNEACIPKARRDPWLAENCRKACDARSCCFVADPGNCALMDQEWCDEFGACRILYT